MKVKISNANIPSWKEVTVKSRIPDELKKLSELSRNMWWSWNHEATDLLERSWSEPGFVAGAFELRTVGRAGKG